MVTLISFTEPSEHEQSHITPGDAVAAMVLNGLGFVSRPLMLAPQFF
jgi:hypothetical protein